MDEDLTIFTEDDCDAALAHQQELEAQRFEEEQSLLRADPSFDEWLEYVDCVLDATVGKAQPIDKDAERRRALSHALLEAERQLNRAQRAYDRALVRCLEAARVPSERYITEVAS